MDQGLTGQLLLYIVDQLGERRAVSSAVRLLNLLYLVDLAYYGRRGQTLTGIEWLRSEYGPYFVGWPDLVRSLGIDHRLAMVATERLSDNQVESPSPEGLPTGVRAVVDEVLAQRGGEDLETLLADINATPPVRCGVIDAPLDFTLETDHLLLEEAKRTATDFLTLDELVAVCHECGDDG
jgi:hypothetical protein